MDMYYLARDGVARVLKAQNWLFALGALGLLLLRERNQAEQQQKSKSWRIRPDIDFNTVQHLGIDGG